MNINKDIKAYIRSIKLLLPMYGHSERDFIIDLTARIHEFVQESPTITIKDIEAQFGTPHEISQSYISTMDMDIFIKRLSITRILRRIFIAFIVYCILVVSIFAVFTYKAYLDSKNTIITNTETVLSDE